MTAGRDGAKNLNSAPPPISIWILGRTFYLVDNLLFLESYMSLNASVATASTIFRLSWQSPTSPLPRLPTIWASTALGSLDTL